MRIVYNGCDVYRGENTMLTREDILKILRENKGRFAEKYGVTKLGLFGSFARGDATEESDVDVCVEVVKPDYFLMFDLREEIAEKRHVPSMSYVFDVKWTLS